MNTIKCLTFWQPWGTLVMIGAKPWEFRGRSYLNWKGLRPSPGEQIGIHAGARPIRPAEIRDLLNRLDDRINSTGLVPELARPLLERLMAAAKCRGVVEMSALLGTARIGAPRLSAEVKPEWAELIADSDRLEHCNWAWPMNDVRRFSEPKFMPGHQSFWNCAVPEAELARDIE